MADNRMFLIHRRLMIGIKIASRGHSWADDNPRTGKFDRFFNYVSHEATDYQDADDFVLALEISANHLQFKDWVYGGLDDSGFYKFERKTKTMLANWDCII